MRCLPTRAICRTALAMVVVLGLTPGCTSLGYYSQVTRGHLELMSRRVPIAEVLQDPGTDETLKARLLNVQEAREFAVAELGLPDNGSYRSYADLERPYVLWNVFATDEFSTEATTWCYLFVGCLGYRGYYDESQAREVADELMADGFDAFVGGVPAYSTLGKFDDPVLNTMLRRGDAELAALLFHELTHQVVYRTSDSEFSESLASYVELEGLRRWLIKTGDEALIERYRAAKVREKAFVDLVSTTRDRLTELYASGQTEAAMRIEKARLFETLKTDYATLKEQQWDGYSGYDAWFDRDLNNSHLVSISTYNRLVPAFAQVMHEAGGSFDIFFERSAQLAKLDDEALSVEMQRLLDDNASRVSGQPAAN